MSATLNCPLPSDPDRIRLLTTFNKYVFEYSKSIHHSTGVMSIVGLFIALTIILLVIISVYLCFTVYYQGKKQIIEIQE